ncbi:hypothetical protein NDU88_004621 [Pleurodeles waltl]|uniref:Uncharacterized protein n=1 Tax=Pleurodeles waltl TaxID=8319 RepID=A0AAV7L0T9_PLEWA|nr:hypothetical protein NDU88_004621 [Pleurodeles waltl]
MVAASSRDHRVLRVGRAFRGAVLPELLIMPGSDCAVIPGALGHSRAQDFDSPNCIKCPDDQWSSKKRDQGIPKTIEFLSFLEPLGYLLVAVATASSLVPVVILIILKYQHIQ